MALNSGHILIKNNKSDEIDFTERFMVIFKAVPPDGKGTQVL